jgi:hypothetical protein
MRFCLDGRTHAATALPYESLSRFQGPSLLVYNDALLEEAELRSIGRIPKGSDDASSGSIGYELRTEYTRFPLSAPSTYVTNGPATAVSTGYLTGFARRLYLSCVHPTPSHAGEGVRFRWLDLLDVYRLRLPV